MNLPLSTEELLRRSVPDLVDDRIWAPSFPFGVDAIIWAPMTPRDQTFDLHLNMNFGGVRGCLLPLLERVVAVMFSYSKHFLGFEFFYSNRTSSFYGRRSAINLRRRETCGMELSFFVQGAKGERISAIGVESYDSGRDVGAVQVCSMHWSMQVCAGSYRFVGSLDSQLGCLHVLRDHVYASCVEWTILDA